MLKPRVTHWQYVHHSPMGGRKMSQYPGHPTGKPWLSCRCKRTLCHPPMPTCSVKGLCHQGHPVEAEPSSANYRLWGHRHASAHPGVHSVTSFTDHALAHAATLLNTGTSKYEQGPRSKTQLQKQKPDSRETYGTKERK